MRITSGKHLATRLLPMLLLTAWGASPLVLAETLPPQTARPDATYPMLVGKWVRPDGGYAITIKGVDAEGKLDAMYANPAALPFSKAQASRDGAHVRLFFELVAGGYAGSTYTLAYEPATDMLHGVYYQAVAKQSFEVYFTRSK